MKKESFPVKRSIGLLLDPDKANGNLLKGLINAANKSRTDYILAGGSLSSAGIGSLITSVKKLTTIPVILFPGNLLQLCREADAILFLSLISGRNPEFLIGNHVIAAPYLRDIKESVIPTGYVLISCGNRTSVEYMSQTESIPADKPDIAVATALAGEMLGMRMIYLEAGSGAETHVPEKVIKAVRENISIPLAVGGGIRNADEVGAVFSSGADLVILGNACEENPGLLEKACEVRNRFREK